MCPPPDEYDDYAARRHQRVLGDCSWGWDILRHQAEGDGHPSRLTRRAGQPRRACTWGSRTTAALDVTPCVGLEAPPGSCAHTLEAHNRRVHGGGRLPARQQASGPALQRRSVGLHGPIPRRAWVEGASRSESVDYLPPQSSWAHESAHFNPQSPAGPSGMNLGEMLELHLPQELTKHPRRHPPSGSWI